MNLVDNLNEIIKLNNRRLRALKNIKIGSFEFDDYVSRFNVDIDDALYIKLQQQEKINKKYDLEISEIYKQINNGLKNNEKLINPFIKKGE